MRTTVVVLADLDTIIKLADTLIAELEGARADPPGTGNGSEMARSLTASF